MNRRILLKAMGILISLIAAYIMFDGTLFGENTSGYATVLGIIDIGLIASINRRLVIETKDKGTR